MARTRRCAWERAVLARARIDRDDESLSALPRDGRARPRGTEPHAARGRLSISVVMVSGSEAIKKPRLGRPPGDPCQEQIIRKMPSSGRPQVPMVVRRRCPVEPAQQVVAGAIRRGGKHRRLGTTEARTETTTGGGGSPSGAGSALTVSLRMASDLWNADSEES